MALHLSFVTLDVFTATRFAGNPLAIVYVPDGQDVSTEQMQTIAREFNLSETLFIHGKQKAADGIPVWRVRIFVTDAELPFAGHPTIGASVYALGNLEKGAKKGRLLCNAGTIGVDFADGVARASIPHNVHKHTEHAFTVDDVLALHPSLGKVTGKPKAIDLVSPVKGLIFICIELPDLETLGALDTSGPTPSTSKADSGWNEGLVGSFPYVITDTTNSTVKIRTRMLIGPLEDPATGSASCALAAFLAMKLKLARTTKFELTQAVEMGRQSDIGVEVTLKESFEEVEKIVLSGSAVEVMEGKVKC